MNERLRYCIHQMNNLEDDNPEWLLWAQAASIYLHILSCKKSHTEQKDGREKCHKFDRS